MIFNSDDLTNFFACNLSIFDDVTNPVSALK